MAFAKLPDSKRDSNIKSHPSGVTFVWAFTKYLEPPTLDRLNWISILTLLLLSKIWFNEILVMFDCVVHCAGAEGRDICGNCWTGTNACNADDFWCFFISDLFMVWPLSPIVFV